MRLNLLLFLLTASRAHGFFMMMMKPVEGDAKQMMASPGGGGASSSTTDAPSSVDPAGTTTTTTTTLTLAEEGTASSSTPKGDSKNDATEKQECIDPSALDGALAKAKEAEAARDLAVKAEQEAKEALRVESKKECGDESSKLLQEANKKARELEAALEKAMQAEEEGKELLRAAEEEVATLRQSLEQHQSSAAAASKAVTSEEHIHEFHEKIWKELSQINDNSVKQLNVVKEQIQAQTQRQAKTLKAGDKVSAERVHKIEKEKIELQGELKALHELYNRLDQKYDAKLQQEENEKLAYFAQNLDQEVARIVDERQLEWEATFQDFKNRSALELQDTKTKAAAQLSKQKVELETKLQETNAAHQKELENVHAAHAKELEKAAAKSKQELEDLETRIVADANRYHAKVKKEHENDVAALEKQIKEAKRETEKALVKSHEFDERLRKTKEHREQQKKEYEEKIDNLKRELHEAHEETAYWTRAFATRAYFNATQVRDDLYAFMDVAYVSATEGIQQQVESANKGMQYVNRLVDSYTRPVADAYNKHLSKHVNAAGAAVRPIYDKNVAPLVDSADRVRRQKSDEFYKALDDGFEFTVSLARKRCKSSQKHIDKAPAMVRERMRKVCREPEAVISDGLRLFVVLLLILFRRPLWNLLWTGIRTIWYVVSLGFLRRKRVPPITADDSNGTSSPPDQAPPQ